MRTLKSIFFVLIAFILLIILGPIAFIANLIFRKNKADYLFNIAIGIDQLGGEHIIQPTRLDCIRLDIPPI